MALIPSASVAIDDSAGTFAGGTGFCVLLGCTERNADLTPRVFSSSRAMLAQHGYSPALAYAELHFDETRQPIVFVGLPTVTAGVIGRQNATGVLGTSVISAAAGPNGVLEETVCSFTVTLPGTIGINGIQGNFSADGGRINVPVKLGTASTYTVLFLGIVLNFGAGTLLAGDTFTFTTTAPMWDSAGITAARLALAAQNKISRTFMVIGDIPDATTAGFITSMMNSYETANQRFCLARVQVRDQLPLAAKSRVTKTMTGAPSITFGATTTITRATGSFLTEGFLVGDVVTIGGTVSNNGSKGAITAVTALVMTFAAGIVAEGPIGTVILTGSEGLVFAATSCTRSVGNWLSDGFRVGDSVTFSGTVSNNAVRVITALTSTVLTFASGGVAETIGSALVTATKGETLAAYVALMDSTFAGVDAQRRIDVGIGRGRKASLLTGWQFRRPCQWAFSIREYQNDLHIPVWRKMDGPCRGWDLNDAANVSIVEYDDRIIGGASIGRFSSFRTWANGPNGTYGSLSLTRALEGSLLSRTHNMQVANLACSTVQNAAEEAIGAVLILNTNGTGTDQSLQMIEEGVNTDLANALLRNSLNQGPRATSATWRASRTDPLNFPGATLTGTLDLILNGTVEQIATTVKVR